MQRSTVRPALLASFAWTLIVWWFGESFGLLFTAQANPLSGAPGAVVLYAIVGAIAWPGSGRFTGERLARAAWCGLWLLMAWLWLGPAASGADAVSATIRDAPSGFGLLHAVQSGTASAAAGHGLAIAIVLAAASVTIGVGGAYGREPGRFLALGAGLNVGFWLLGQGLGGIFEGGATDPNTGPLFVLMAFAVYSATHAPGVPAALDASGRASATPVARTAVTAPPRAAPAA